MPTQPLPRGGARRESAAQAVGVTLITLLKGESGSQWMRRNLASLMRQGPSQRSRGASAYHGRISEWQSLHLGFLQLTLKPHSPGNPELRRRPLPLSCCYGPPDPAPQAQPRTAVLGVLRGTFTVDCERAAWLEPSESTALTPLTSSSMISYVTVSCPMLTVTEPMEKTLRPFRAAF